MSEERKQKKKISIGFDTDEKRILILNVFLSVSEEPTVKDKNTIKYKVMNKLKEEALNVLKIDTEYIEFE